MTSSNDAMSALSGAEAARHAAPLGLPECMLRQMQHDAPHRALDPGAEFEQALAQARHLRSRAVGAGCGSAQLLHEHIGGCGEQHTQLIGPEVGAAGAVDLQSIMQLFDAILDFAASRSAKRTTSALMITRRWRCQVPAA